jgi:hypothetical protein
VLVIGINLLFAVEIDEAASIPYPEAHPDTLTRDTLTLDTVSRRTSLLEKVAQEFS